MKVILNYLPIPNGHPYVCNGQWHNYFLQPDQAVQASTLSFMCERCRDLIELEIWQEGIIEFGRMEQHAFLNCQGFTISKCIKVNLQQKLLFY